MRILLTKFKGYLIKRLIRAAMWARNLSSRRGTIEIAFAMVLVIVAPLLASGFAASILTEGIQLRWAKVIAVPVLFVLISLLCMNLAELAIPFVAIGLTKSNDEVLELFKKKEQKVI